LTISFAIRALLHGVPEDVYVTQLSVSGLYSIYGVDDK
jgi:hypothetical protein